MSKVRIYTLAKDLGVENHKMLEILDGLGVSYKSVSSTIDEENVEIIKQILADEAAEGGDASGRAAETGRATRVEAAAAAKNMVRVGSQNAGPSTRRLA